MFGRRRPLTLIAEGSEIGGGVSATGMVEINGTVNGDVDCGSVFISKAGRVNGKVEADSVIVAGTVDGPVFCSRLHLKSGARVIGDIQYDTLIVDQGGHFEGRSLNKEEPEQKKVPRKPKARAKAPRKKVAKRSAKQRIKKPDRHPAKPAKAPGTKLPDRAEPDTASAAKRDPEPPVKSADEIAKRLSEIGTPVKV